MAKIADNKSTMEETPTLVFEGISGYRRVNGQMEFSIKYKNSKLTSWENLSNLHSVKTHVIDYLVNEDMHSLVQVVNNFYNKSCSSQLIQKASKVIAKNDDPVYYVEKVVSHRRQKKKLQFLIKWKNYNESDNTWEPLENIENAKDHINNYLVNKNMQAVVKEVEDFYKKSNSSQLSQKTTEEIAEEDSPIYYVEKVMSHRRQNKKLQFLVKWLNYDDSDNTWEPLENLLTANTIVYQYLENLGLNKLIGEVKEFYSDA